MKKRILTITKYLFFLALGIFLVWFSVKDFTEKDKQDFFASVQAADYKWIFLSIFLGILSHISRAIRWIMLMEPVGYTPGRANTFFAVMVGYLANFAFPRLGEVTRCGVLSKYEKIPFPVAFGTVIAERAVDLICLGIIFLVTFFSMFDSIYGLTDAYILTPLAEKLGRIAGTPLLFWGIIGSLAAIVFLFLLLRNKIGGMLSGKVKEMLKGFWTGLMSIRKMRSPGMFIAHTIFIWVMYYTMLHVCFFSFEETSGMSIGQGMTVLIMGAVGIMFTQGGIGAYHFLVSKTLTSSLAGISIPVAGAFSWVVWASQFVTILLTGVISLILLPILNREQGTGNREQEKGT